MTFRDRTHGSDGDPEIGSKGQVAGPDDRVSVAAPGMVRQRALSVGRGPTRPVAMRPAGAALVLRQAELALSGQGRCVPRRLVRVPLGAMVPVRSKMPGMPAPTFKTLRLASPAASRARDGVEAAHPSPSRAPDVLRARPGKVVYILREVVMLALFAATLAATYYLGRTHAFQNVIIVPEPWSRHSTLS